MIKAASLSASLLAAKGTAGPVVERTWAGAESAAGAQAGPASPPAASVVAAFRRTAVPAAEPRPGGRAKLSLRLDPVRHLRLKLATAHLDRSAQQILVAALDAFLERSAPEVHHGNCACFAEARPCAVDLKSGDDAVQGAAVGDGRR